MNEYPKKSAYFAIGTATALSAVVLSGSGEPAGAKNYESFRQSANGNETTINGRMLKPMGRVAIASYPDDKYATKNLPRMLKRIGGCETRNSPTARINYKSQNPSSTASGGFQFLDTTWDRYMGYKEAWKAPHRVQNKKAIITYKKEGTKPWYASKPCWG